MTTIDRLFDGAVRVGSYLTIALLKIVVIIDIAIVILLCGFVEPLMFGFPTFPADMKSRPSGMAWRLWNVLIYVIATPARVLLKD